MPQPKKGPRLGANPKHQRLMLANLAASLFEHGRIQTTEAKAKQLRPYADRLITKAKSGTIHARRQVLSVIPDRDIVHKLFAEIGPTFADRNGGYTRILKIGPRNGDGADMALIELVAEPGAITGTQTAEEGTRRRRLKRPTRRRQAEEEAAPEASAEEGAMPEASAEEEPEPEEPVEEDTAGQPEASPDESEDDAGKGSQQS